jgi:DedD protein
MNAYKDTEPGSVTVRRRVVGALVLLALAIIVVPLLVDFRQDYDPSIRTTNIPPKPEGYHVEVLRLPATDAARATDALAVSPHTIIEHDTPASSAVQTSVPESVKQPSGETPHQGRGAAPTTATLTDLPRPQAWVVQVGSFGSEPNALALRDKLRAQGYAAFVEKMQVDGKSVVRVGVGPETIKTRSEQLRDKLAHDMGLSGLVVAYTGDE